MKRSIALLLLAFTAATAHAGSFFGPPPFTNGSPLVTGVDGTYQASARSKNVAGVFRFAYSGGSQTSTATANSWVFFVDGQVTRGTTTAAIGDMNVSGILDSGVGGTTGTNGTTFPIVFQSGSSGSFGEFSGKMNANGSFKGSGTMAPGSGTNIVTIVNTNVAGTLYYLYITNSFNGSGITNTFKFNGVRTSTTAN